MTYDDYCRIARLAQRWTNDTDPAHTDIRLAMRYNYFIAATEYWGERQGAAYANGIWDSRTPEDIDYANRHWECGTAYTPENHAESGRAKTDHPYHT